MGGLLPDSGRRSLLTNRNQFLGGERHTKPRGGGTRSGQKNSRGKTLLEREQWGEKEFGETTTRRVGRNLDFPLEMTGGNNVTRHKTQVEGGWGE